MALYQDGILISGANTLPKMTLAEYNALPADQRPTYWERLDADYDDVLAEKTDIAPKESGTTASRAYSAGEMVYVSGTLYKVKTAIASGATFTVGTNIEAKNVSDAIDGKVSKSGDTMTGVLTIDQANGTASTVGTSRLNIGNAIPSGTEGNSTGFLFLYGNNNRYTRLSASNPTSNRNIELPNAAGTILLNETVRKTASFTGDTAKTTYTGTIDKSKFIMACFLIVSLENVGYITIVIPNTGGSVTVVGQGGDFSSAFYGIVSATYSNSTEQITVTLGSHGISTTKITAVLGYYF